MVYHQEAAIYLDRCKTVLQSQEAGVEQKRQVLVDLLAVVSSDPELQLPGVFSRIDAGKFRHEFRRHSATPLVEWLCSIFIEYNAVLVATSPDLRDFLVQLIVACDDSLSAVLLLCTFERRIKTFSETYFVASKALLLHALYERQDVLAQLIVRFATAPTNTDVAFEGDMIGRLISVPDVASSLLGSEGSDSFFRDQTYFTATVKQIAIALERLSNLNREAKTDINLRFAGRLLGRIAARGYHDLIWNTFMSSSLSCSHLLETDQIYVRLFSTVISNSPVGGGLENLLIALLARAPHYEHVKRILGSLVARRSDVEQLFTRQFVFSRSFTKVQLCRNLIGYLGSSHAWSHLFQKLIVKLVEVWGSRVGIRHQSYEQQLYLSRLLMCSAVHVPSLKLDEVGDAGFDTMFRSKLIDGVTHHLESPIAKVSALGMVVGETLTTVLYPPDKEKPDEGVRLQFTYDVDDEIAELKTLASPQQYVSWQTPKLVENVGEEDDAVEVGPQEPVSPPPLIKAKTLSIHRQPLAVISASTSTVTNETPPDVSNTSYKLALECSFPSVEKVVEDKPAPVTATSNEVLDSDDDELPPLEQQSVDISNETTIELPKTVRQCLEMLNSREQDYPVDYFERFVLYLRALPILIRASTVDLSELSVELSNRLLSLECPCRMADFLAVRIDAMVAITVACPVPVARFLTSQFYEPTFSISHRLDILKVLTMAAEILAMPADAQVTPSKPSNKLALLSEMTNLCHPLETPEWRQVVDKRIREKAVYFGHRRSQNEPQKEAHNRFGQVAGEFFYPLLRRYDGTSPQLDLVNRDFMVLERLIYSLAIIYHSAADTTGHTKMTKIFLEFLLAVRNHEQPVIRRAVVFSFGYIFLDVPPVLLKTAFDPEIQDSSNWLVERCINDSDAEIGRLTENVLARLYDALRVPE